MPTSRRSFLASTGAAALARGGSTEPELILFNGNIHTLDAAGPRAQAVAIAQGRFLAVGTNDQIRPLSTARTRRIDLGGKTVTPGFIDAHTHVASSGLRHLREVDCDLRSIAEIQAAIRRRAAATPPGDWVLGFKYDDTKTAEGRPLTRADLDAAAPGHPVFVNHRGGHLSFANSLAFERAGINDRTPDPRGGRFDRDAAGRLAGCVRERANDPFHRVIPEKYTREDRREGVKIISQMMTRAGVTSVHDAGGAPEDLLAYQDAREQGQLGLRVYCLIRYTHLGKMIAAGVRTGMGDEWVRVGACKLVCDGSISERTARMSEPYIGRPADFGILVTEEEELYAQARAAHQAGWQVGTHANGDVAIDLTLRVYERLQREMPRRDPRFRLEHCTLINDALVRRIQDLGAIPTPFSTYVYYHGEKMKEYGAARLDRMFAVRSFLDAGVRVTQASDYPPGPFEPMMALQSSVTRTDSKGQIWGARQRVSVEEALRVGTLHGAYASFEEHSKGSIEAGKLADLVVLGRDPLREEPSSLVRIPVERTMVGGRWVFES
ncbi:MAG: amidohydrolase [Acidobacteria bacterium]|nr:amidohydrolase [Acidobacteriota bacterium]MBI3474022.1 amidohydrolase [Candidatus Solibacter usitatus]